MHRMAIRAPAVAGQFYPSDPLRLKKDVSTYLMEGCSSQCQNPKAIIAPHAGYIYSGPIAGSAFLTWKDVSTIRRIILVGPSHRLAFAGLALSSAQAFATPLGKMPLELPSEIDLGRNKAIQVLDEAHSQEHSLEVMLPFLQFILKDVVIIPILVGAATSQEVAEALWQLWGGPETRILISSDLSHYLPYEAAKQLDQKTAHAITKLNPEEIGEDQACGQIAIQGLLKMAQEKHLKAEIIDLRNSGDTAGSRSRVVGYGAFAFEDAA